MSWLFLVIGIVVLVGAGVIALSLAVPRVGRTLLGRSWPGHFTGHQRRRARRAALAMVSAGVLMGSSSIVAALAAAQPAAGLWATVEFVLRTLSILCLVANIWWTTQLLQR